MATKRQSKFKKTNRPTRRGTQNKRVKVKSGQDQGRKSVFAPRVHSKLEPILKEVGSPEITPFVPDPFQTESVEKLAYSDVVVSAPTGSGKTWIAEQAIKAALDKGQRAWYASPLKALSNAKYAEFGELFGPENVGILTGDRKENPSAPLIVGTTEILRNQLYDSMHKGLDLNAGLVVLDEAHYLGDSERGVVWEEVIIYLPVRVRLLLLSATVENADQIARWLNFVRDEESTTVISNQRPVPLYPLFLFPDGEISPLTNKKGLFPKVKRFLEQERPRRHGPLHHLPPVSQVLNALNQSNLLPAIFFLKSRADCDAALGMAAEASLRIEPGAREEMGRYLEEFIEAYPFLKDHPGLYALRRLHVAAHHAGHLPHWKLLVEKLMQKGLLKAIFSTSTVAAGVNFPARTVVVTQSDRFNGREFVNLKATDLLQMTGRAGRRGMDKVGFCLTVPGPFNDIGLLASLLHSTPEPIESQLSINFSMVLNLLLSHRPAEVKQLLGQSLATYQRLESTQKHPKSAGGLQKALKKVGQTLVGSLCPGAEEAVIRRRRRRQLEEIIRRLTGYMRRRSDIGNLWASLHRGRVFMDMYGSLNAVLRREDTGNQPGVLAVSLEQERRLHKGHPRLEFFPLDQVAGVYREVMHLPRAGGGRVLSQAVLDQSPRRPRELTAKEQETLARERDASDLKRIKEAEEELKTLICAHCPSEEKCRQKDSDLAKALDHAEGLLVRMQEESHTFWYDFVRYLEFLRTEGYVDDQGQLTADGLWASKLRLDQPMIIAEAIRQKALPENDPVLLAGLVALFVDDRERETDSPYLSHRLQKAMNRLKNAITPLMDRLRQWGFGTAVMPPTAGAAVFAWGLSAEFNEAVLIYGGAEGDLAQLIYRTADNLRQLTSLHETHPALAASAREGVELLLRPPVVVPT